MNLLSNDYLHVKRTMATSGYGENLYEVLTLERGESGRILACG
jgi:hypothetical protein